MTTQEKKNDKALGKKKPLNTEKILKWMFIAFLIFVILILVLYDLSN